jgi:dTDP-4-amino-4,6-dideoxygalactose transaminase
MPFVDLTLPSEIEEEIKAAIRDVIEGKQFILGDAVETFEDAFAGYCGTKHAVGVGSGTAALHLALLACGVGPRTSVVTVPNTYVATVEAIRYTGARVILVDVDAGTALMDVTRLEEAIEPDTRAIVPVHLYGQMADMGTISKIAGKHELVVVEDACQAHGAAYEDAGRYVVEKPGGSSHVACFSFYPTKNLGAYGDGGAIVTHREDIAGYIRMLRNHGQQVKNTHLALGYNSRLDSIQAAVLSVKLKHLNMWNAARYGIAKLYDELLPYEVKPIQEASWTHYHSYHLYVVVCETMRERDELKKHLEAAGINTGIHYPVPIHLQPAYTSLGYERGDLPVAESLSDRMLSLPMYPGITEDDVRYICEQIKQYFTRSVLCQKELTTTKT